ncbi:uncharacterized protein LOC128953268 [Oppia nitens]|uniref:uncharacterized protein LOC128953268 n=1 Tax=Oppia nitens TaxID=1686743 RepID=UPI0023DC4B04|nr:uncharacterized protein LOC128953268 [Oppia nitens]
MKFVIALLALFVYAVSAAPTSGPSGSTRSPYDKSELERRARTLEARLENDIQRLQEVHKLTREELVNLVGLDGELRILSAELALARKDDELLRLEKRLDALENAVEAELKRIEKLLTSPTAGPQPTSAAPQPTTGAPASTRK